MKSLLKIGLEAQKMQVMANTLTDEDVKEIKKSGKRIVCRPNPVKSNVVSLEDKRVMDAFVSPEAV